MMLALTAFFGRAALLYLVGFEFGVLLLPIAHGWQHVPQHRNGVLVQQFFNVLERCGLVANKKDHHKHHNYRSETVYQDFSSSGLYSAKVDAAINRFWDNAVRAPGKPFDTMKPTIYAVYAVCFAGLPFVTLSTSNFFV